MLRHLFDKKTVLTLLLTVIPVVTSVAGIVKPSRVPLRETYDEACCDALYFYALCEDSDPSYKQNFKTECSYLGSRIRSYSMDDLEQLYNDNCQEYQDSMNPVICNFRVD